MTHWAWATSWVGIGFYRSFPLFFPSITMVFSSWRPIVSREVVENRILANAWVLDMAVKKPMMALMV